MPSIANNKKSSNRRNTFGGEGVENAVNKKKPSRQSISGGDQQQSNNKVRWNVPKTTSATNNNNLNTSISTTNNMTPSKRVVDKFVNVASGKEKDVVRNYHFEGTPFASSKKKRRKHHNSSNNNSHITDSSAQNGGGEYTASLSAANAIDNSFQLNNDTTAEILKMATASNNTSIALDPLDESLLSAASSSTASSSSVDPLTLSDTHELSTSNFIQNTKMRGILANRAKELYGNNNKDGGGNKGKKMDSVWEKPFGDNNLAGKNNNQGGNTEVNSNTATAVGERQISNSFSSLIDGVGLEASSTLTLPDLTMNITGVLPSTATVAAVEEQQERLAANQEEEDEEDSEILEFTSHQKSRTPRKSPSRELSMLNDNSTSDDNTTRSVGGLDSMLANFDDDEVEDGKQVANKGKKEATMTTDLSKLIEESAKMMADGEEEGSAKRRSGETSFVESTASQGDLANLLNDDTEEVEESGTEKNQTSESTPLAASINNTASTPNSSSGLCPSPSFLSGKKQRGSGIPTLRKSLGGDVTKIRKLTASLRKEKKSKKRMSLPALAMAKQQQAPGGGRLSMDVLDNTESGNMKEQEPQPKSPELANSPARNTRSAKKSPIKSPAVDSPARNTRGSAKKSPRKSPSGKHILFLTIPSFITNYIPLSFDSRLIYCNRFQEITQAISFATCRFTS